jgi:hypothetical protein
LRKIGLVLKLKFCFALVLVFFTEFSDKVSPIHVVANSLIEGLLAYSKRQDGKIITV